MRCIDSILNQKTDFDFEVLIANDNSTDTTGDIVNKYLGQVSGRACLRFINRPLNIGGSASFVDTLNKCTGVYVGYCEGDDYWTTDRKLQMQIDALVTTQTDYCIAGCTVESVNFKETGEATLLGYYKEIENMSVIESYKFSKLSSQLIKLSVLQALVKQLLESCGTSEFAIGWMCAEYHKGVYLREVVSAYTVTNQGSWSGISELQRVKYHFDQTSRLVNQLKRYAPFIQLQSTMACYWLFSKKENNKQGLVSFGTVISQTILLLQKLISIHALSIVPLLRDWHATRRITRSIYN